MSDRERRRGGILGMVALGLILAAVTVVGLVAWKPELLLREQRLAVTIEPRDVVAAGAAWKISGAWMRTDTSTVDEAARKRVVEFSPVPGWVTPQGVDVAEGGSEQAVRGVYTRQVLAEKTILRLHGSNTIGATLGPDLAERYLRWLGAESVRVLVGADPAEKIVEGVFPFRNEALRVEIKAHGSSTGFKDLLGGTCDAAMSSRRIKDSERAALAHLGDMTSVDSEYVVALDGIAVIVHRGNPLGSLTRRQIADIFAGRITDWKALGLPAGPIEIHARNDESGTFDTFQSLVLGKDALASGAIRHESNAELSDAVAANPHAIGFCGLPYINKSKELSVQDEGKAIAPSMFSVSTEDYPLSRRLYLYAPQRGVSAHLRQFLDLTLAREGQEAVAKYGFVSLDISGTKSASAAPEQVRPAVADIGGSAVNETEVQTSPVETMSAEAVSAESVPAEVVPAEGAPMDAAPVRAAAMQVEDPLHDVPVVNAGVAAAYRDSVRGGARLPVNFRFHSGSFDLDNKALRDVSRVAELASNEGKPIVLVGFSDSLGDYGQNLALSKRRAQAVADHLAALGTRVQAVVGAGEEGPVASNQDQDGRERNRRVEAWVLQ